MTYKEYAQNIVKGCGRKLIQFPFVASADNCGEINPDNLQIELCLKCQRARQTATDLGKKSKEDLKNDRVKLEILLSKIVKVSDCSVETLKEKEHYNFVCNLITEKINEIKDYQEGLKILGETS